MTEDLKEQAELLKNQLSKIKNTIVVLSGKGGVGKSTVATNIAISLSLKGFKIGLLDIDVHGPSIPKLFGIENERAVAEGKTLMPIQYNENLKVISVGFFLQDNTDPIVWRGPMKMKFIQQMLSDVAWGELDYLIVDCPPGTGDEPLSIIQTLEKVTGSVIVTTPQKVATFDVRKSVNFCKKMDTPILGVIENMSGFFCPDCKKVIDIFGSGGGEEMAKEMDVPFLGSIPMEKAIAESGDLGKPFSEACKGSQTANKIEEIIKPLEKLMEGK